jgi:LmbE family N-acetylglucosaminyl deacetylase
MVGEFAQAKHRRWKLTDPDSVHQKRRDEDAECARILGCGIRWLGLPDAIYRGDRYASDAALYGALDPEELALAQHLAEELHGLPETDEAAVFFVPLGVGSHVDHQLVFEAGRQLARRGVEVWAYEDLPYAIHSPEALRERLARLGPAVGSMELSGVTGWLDRKVAAVAAYDSQVPVIFRFTDDFAGAIVDHARNAGEPSGAAERFWRVMPG